MLIDGSGKVWVGAEVDGWESRDAGARPRGPSRAGLDVV